MDLENEATSTTHDQEIARLLECAEEQGEPDTFAGKRGATRFAVGVQLDATTDPSSPMATWPATTHNVSDSGLAFWSKRQLHRGTDIHVREFSEDESVPWLPVHVTHCTLGIRGYLIGVSYV